MFQRSLVVVGTLILIAAGMKKAEAGIITVGDFQGNQVVQDYEGLGLPVSNPTPLVIGGDTYTSRVHPQAGSIIRYFSGAGSFAGGSGFGLATNVEPDFIDIALGTAVNRAGIFVGTSRAWTADVSFFDQSDSLLGTVALSSSGPGLFAGWEADTGLIGRIRIDDTDHNGRVVAIDNLTTEVDATVVPEPTSFVLLGIGTFGLVGYTWRRRNRQPAPLDSMLG